nr:putative ribonuclease H-like domain-containing protein [Tanacetum cinerariifolium]
MNKASDLEDTTVNDRYTDGMHAIPPPMTRNYMPSRPDVEIDYFKFTYGLKQTSVDESKSKRSEYASCKSDSSVETTTYMAELVENASKVVCEPKVWTDTPIIEEYESDSDNDLVSNVKEEKEKPSFAFTNSVKHVKTSRRNIKETSTTNHSPKIEKQDRNTHTRKGLEYAFTRNTCFLCNGRITSKGKIKANMLDFKDVFYVEELKYYNLFFVSQMCDKKNKVLFTDTDGLVMSPNFKLPDENQKGKQHKASCKDKTVSSVNQPLQILHMDLFRPISVRSNNHKTYCLVITDGFISTSPINTASTPISTDGPSREFNDGELSYPDDPSIPHLEDIYASPSEGIFTNSSYDDEGVVTNFNNLETIMNVISTCTTRIQTIHPRTQIVGDPMSSVQARSKVNKNSEAYALKLWILIELPFRKKAIKTKWVYRNKKDEIGIVVRNKARLVTRGHRQEEGLEYDEVFSPVARIEVIRIFLAFASYMGFIVYQMNVKSAFLYALELMLPRSLKKNTKCVNVAGEELSAAKHKFMLLVYY